MSSQIQSCLFDKVSASSNQQTTVISPEKEAMEDTLARLLGTQPKSISQLTSLATQENPGKKKRKKKQKCQRMRTRKAKLEFARDLVNVAITLDIVVPAETFKMLADAEASYLDHQLIEAAVEAARKLPVPEDKAPKYDFPGPTPPKPKPDADETEAAKVPEDTATPQPDANQAEAAKETEVKPFVAKAYVAKQPAPLPKKLVDVVIAVPKPKLQARTARVARCPVPGMKGFGPRSRTKARGSSTTSRSRSPSPERVGACA